MENRIQELNTELESIRKDHMRGLLVRTKARWIEEGEKPTKYFCSLEKRNFTNKNLTKIVNDKGEHITDQKHILEQIKQFYESLYSDNDMDLEDVDLNKLLQGVKVPKLSGNIIEMLEKQITIDEIGNTLKNMKNDKSPGPDGFTAEFF